MKLSAIVFPLIMVGFSAQAADVETDCRDYDGGFHAEAMRLKMLESKDASQDKAAAASPDNSPASTQNGTRASGGDQAAGQEK
jgi:hypothetical protein